MQELKSEAAASAAENVSVLPQHSTVDMLQALIDRVSTCERVFDLANVPGYDRSDDVVFVDDLAVEIAANSRVNEANAASASIALAARYSAMLKAALHVLLQIRQVQNELAAKRARSGHVLDEKGSRGRAGSQAPIA